MSIVVTDRQSAYAFPRESSVGAPFDDCVRQDRIPDRIPVALAIEDPSGLCRTVVRDLTHAGWYVLPCEKARASTLALEHRPDLIIVALDDNTVAASTLLESLAEASPGSRKVVLTDAPLGSNMVKLLCAGADDLLTTPVTLRVLVGGSDVARPDRASWSLERAKWEHIKYVMAHSASLTEAARRLALQPRSLRRMLQKSPPSR